MSFFKQFPTIFYNGHQAKNLLARAKLTPETKKDLSLYYPYTMKDHDGRAEVLAEHYYNDPYAVWMIYFANEVVDPYYDLGLDQANFDKYITKKYGSIANAQSKIIFYRTNWELLDDTSITVAVYSALDSSEKKYWDPVLDINGAVSNYKRRREDLIINTNRVYELTVTGANGTFTNGEKLEANSSIYGFVTHSNSTMVTIQHVTGVNTSNIPTMTVTGQDSNATATVANSILLSENITSNVQASYWTSVSYYDNELEVNTLKRNIYLLDKRHRDKLESEFKKIMRT